MGYSRKIQNQQEYVLFCHDVIDLLAELFRLKNDNAGAHNFLRDCIRYETSSFYKSYMNNFSLSHVTRNLLSLVASEEDAYRLGALLFDDEDEPFGEVARALYRGRVCGAWRTLEEYGVNLRSDQGVLLAAVRMYLTLCICEHKLRTSPLGRAQIHYECSGKVVVFDGEALQELPIKVSIKEGDAGTTYQVKMRRSFRKTEEFRRIDSGIVGGNAKYFAKRLVCCEELVGRWFPPSSDFSSPPTLARVLNLLGIPYGNSVEDVKKDEPVFLLDLGSMDRVCHFVSTTQKMDGEMKLRSGDYLVDARSIMGVMSLDLTRPIELFVEEGYKEIAKQALSVFRFSSWVNEIKEPG